SSPKGADYSWLLASGDHHDRSGAIRESQELRLRTDQRRRIQTESRQDLSLRRSCRSVSIYGVERADWKDHSHCRRARTNFQRRLAMTGDSVSDAAKAVVRRNTEAVQGGGNFDVFEELFADDFVDHTTQPGTSPDKAGVRKLYTYMRAAFPDFHVEIHWQ